MAAQPVGKGSDVKILPRKANGSAFSALIDERVQLEKDFRATQAPRQSKCSAAAMSRISLAVAHSNPERLARVRAELERGPGLDAACAALRRMGLFARSANCGRPPRELRRLNFLLTGDALAELAVIGSSSFELFALAVQLAAEQHPEDFGDCEDPDAADRRLIELATRRDELDRCIAAAWSHEDIDIGPLDSDGRALITFKLTGGAVPLAPKENAGERLVNWILAQGMS